MTTSSEATSAKPGAQRTLTPGRIAALALLFVIAVIDMLALGYMAALASYGGLETEGTGNPVIGGPWIRLYQTAHLFPRWILNSFGVATLTVGFHLLADTMAAFVLAKHKFRGRGLVFALILVAMMVPRQVTLIPLFLGMSRVGLADSFAGLLLPGLGDVVGIFLMRQFLLSLPDSLLEAARIDGASQWQTFWHVVLPLSKPALAVLAVLSFLHYWSDFFWPLVIAHSEPNFTIQTGLAYLVNSEFGVDYGLMAAGACAAAIVPMIVFLLLRKQFFEGMRGGALK